MDDITKTIENANTAIKKLTTLVTEEQDENISLNNKCDEMAADYSKLNVKYIKLKEQAIGISEHLDAGEPGIAEAFAKQIIKEFDNE